VTERELARMLAAMSQGGDTTDELGEGAARAPWIRAAILAGQPFHVREQNPLVHNLKNLSALAVLVGVLVLTAYIGTRVSSLLYAPLAGLSFGLVYFGLFVLVVHEASHDMFLVTKNRALRTFLNRAFGWAVSLVFATHYVKHWEEGHLEHHVRPLEPRDPQKANTLTGPTLLLRVLGCVLVPGFFLVDRTVLRKRSEGEMPTKSSAVIVAFVFIWIALLTLLAITLGGNVALGAYLGLQVLAGLNHIKGSLEHGGALGEEPDPFLRSRSTFFPGRTLLMPFNITLHFEHHLNYRVPWYALMRYHRALRGIVPPELHAHAWNHSPLSQLSGDGAGLARPQFDAS
jgi:fatty acid desaturase